MIYYCETCQHLFRRKLTNCPLCGGKIYEGEESEAEYLREGYSFYELPGEQRASAAQPSAGSPVRGPAAVSAAPSKPQTSSAPQKTAGNDTHSDADDELERLRRDYERLTAPPQAAKPQAAKPQTVQKQPRPAPAGTAHTEAPPPRPERTPAASRPAERPQVSVPRAEIPPLDRTEAEPSDDSFLDWYAGAAGQTQVPSAAPSARAENAPDAREENAPQPHAGRTRRERGESGMVLRDFRLHIPENLPWHRILHWALIAACAAAVFLVIRYIWLMRFAILAALEQVLIWVIIIAVIVWIIRSMFRR